MSDFNLISVAYVIVFCAIRRNMHTYTPTEVAQCTDTLSTDYITSRTLRTISRLHIYQLVQERDKTKGPKPREPLKRSEKPCSPNAVH